MDGIKFEIYGKSHDESVGVKINGINGGTPIDVDKLQAYVNKRKPKEKYSTSRAESDKLQIKSGIENGRFNGKQIVVEIKNVDVRSDDYEEYKYIPRPSHADLSMYNKTGNIEVGGGEYSGRLTVCMAVVGGIAKQILESYGISVTAYVSSIGKVNGKSYKEGEISVTDFPFVDENDRQKLTTAIYDATSDGDSVGGTVECIVTGLEKGLGGAYYEGIEGTIAKAVYAVPAVKGVEFGDGFTLSESKGTSVLDETYYDNGVKFYSNHNGGILGGVTTGQPVTLRVAVKPTPTVNKPVRTVDLKNKRSVEITFKGRHDSCIVPRAVIPIESAVAVEILNLVYKKNLDGLRNDIDDIDKQIAVLFSKRMDTVNEIGKFKKQNGIAVTNPEREKEVIDAAVSNGKKEYSEYETRLFEDIIKLSKEYQEKQ